MLRITELKTDYLNNAVGIVETPQFTWFMESDHKNVKQTAYRLQVASDKAFEGLLYDSGITYSDKSAHVSPDNLDLKTASVYYARVRVWDNYDEDSSYCPAVSFLTGVVHPDEWTANFISAETKEDADKSNGTYLRKDVEIKKTVKKAIAYTTALGIYHFYLNGQKVGNDEMAPGWTVYNKRLMYQSHDITSALKEGINGIGAHVGPGWYKGTMGFLHHRNIYGDRTGFFCQIFVEYEDGTDECFITDNSWKCADSPVTFSEIYDGEIYDARLEQNGWNKAGFADEKWRDAEVLDVDKNVLTAQKGCAVKQITPIPTAKLIKTPQGDTVIDFGQNLTGWAEFMAQGSAGEKIVLHFFETLDKDGNVYLDNLRTAKQMIEYTCKDASWFSFRPNFTFQGFQYVKITAYPGEVKAENFTAYAVHSEMEQTGYFECSNPDINQLQHNITWGLKGNFLDVPTDCPQRDERLGWTGDAQIFCRTASYLMDTYTFFSKWLQDLAADQREDGGVPHVIPDILKDNAQEDKFMKKGTYGSAAWGDAAVINTWTHYLTYGDPAIIHQQYNSMKGWIDFMTSHANDGIWDFKLQFGDWVALDAEEGSYFGATPNDLTCTAYYAYSSGLFAKMAKAVGKQDDYEEYQKLHEYIISVFQKNYFKEDGTMTVQTQTAYIVALYFNLTPDAYIDKTVNRLVELLEKEGGHLVTGFVGTPYFCHALSQNGRLKEAYELLLKDDFPSWLFQVRMGATTVWEHWDGKKTDGSMWSPDMNSFNHYAYGAIGEWLYRAVAGIEADENIPGYKHFMIYPRIGSNLDYVKSSYKSAYGKIAVYWHKKGDEVTLNIIVPANTTADIRLENAAQVIASDGITFNKHDTDSFGTVGSGEYTIIYKI